MECNSNNNDNRSVCAVCVKQFSSYTCPRCNMRYCSLSCYKSHNLRCTESFMRDNVLSHLNNTHVSPQTKRNMLQTLKRSYDQDLSSTPSYKTFEDDDDGDEEEDESGSIISEQTVRKLLQGEDVSLEDLSFEERKAFLRAVKSGRVSHLIKPWDPWWISDAAQKLCLSKQGTRLVQALGTGPDVEVGMCDIPAPPKNSLDPLRKLTSVQPSPLLSVHITDIMYSYCFTLRFFNGDWRSDPVDAAVVCMSISRVLGQASTPTSISEALFCCLEAVCSPTFKYAGGYNLGLMLCEDLKTLFGIGKAAVICALADLKCMFESATSSLKSQKSRPTLETSTDKRTEMMTKDHNERKQGHHLGTRKLEASVKKPITSGKDKANLKLLVNKLNFLLSWANESGDDLFQTLADLVGRERSRLWEIKCDENSVAQANASNKGPIINPTIEEIPQVYEVN